MAGDLPETLSKADEIFVSELPTEWKATTLGRYADIRARIGWRGLSASEYTDEGPLLIAGNHIDNGQVRWDQCDHLTQERYDESPEIQLRSNDVVLSKDGTIGRIGFINHLPGPATLNGTMMLVRPDQEAFEPRFVYHYLAGERFQRIVRERVSGSSVPHIFQRDMAGLIIPRPGRHEQQRIASALDNVDAAIDATRGVIEQTRRLKTAVLQDLLTRGLPGRHSEFREVKGLGQVPRAWKHTHIRELCTDIIDCPHTTPNFVDAGVPVIRTSAVRDGVLIDKELTYTSESEYEARTARLVPEPCDIVFTREAPVGEAFVIPEGMRLSLGQRTMLLRPDPTRLDPHFFVSLLYEPRFRRRLLILAGGSTNPHLNVAEVRDLSIATPPIAEQRQITRSLNSMSDRIATGTKHLGQLLVLKTALSQALLTGRVRVPANAVEAV